MKQKNKKVKFYDKELTPIKILIITLFCPILGFIILGWNGLFMSFLFWILYFLNVIIIQNNRKNKK